jgi:heme A synthase
MRNSLTHKHVGAAVFPAGASFFATLAVTVLASTVVLIMVGSFVRVSGNGLGCPDWPLCYGRAMPPLLASAWVEFSHRLLGGLVGAQVAALAYLALRYHRNDPWLWRPATAAGILVILQVALGGIHVLNELPRWTGIMHTAVAMAVAGSLALLVGATAPPLLGLTARLRGAQSRGRMAVFAAVTAGLTYILILTGSLVTRTGASLACPGFPGCGLASISARLAPYVTIQMIHRLAALGVGLLIAYLLIRFWRQAGVQPAARALVLAAAILLSLQIGLGITNVLLALPMWSRVLHLGVGASLWAVVALIATILARARHTALPGINLPGP